MSRKPVVPRARAQRDVEAAIDHYLHEAGRNVALGFIAALQSAFRAIADFPSAGSPRYAQELDLPGLRSRRLKGYPFLVFYIERDGRIDVWRVLHAQRDVPTSIREPES